MGLKGLSKNFEHVNRLVYEYERIVCIPDEWHKC